MDEAHRYIEGGRLEQLRLALLLLNNAAELQIDHRTRRYRRTPVVHHRDVMDHASRPRLRGLDARDPIGLGRPANPFESARKARAERVLRIGLQSSLVMGATPAQQALVASLRTPVAHRAIEVVPVMGRVPVWMRCGPRFRLVERGPDDHEAIVRYRDPERRRVTKLASIPHHEVWRWAPGMTLVRRAPDIVVTAMRPLGKAPGDPSTRLTLSGTSR